MAESNNKNKNSQEEKLEEVTPETGGFQAEQTDTGSDSDDAESEVKPEGKVMKFIKSILPSVGIAIGSILLVYLLHYFGAFNTLELKLYDLRMKLRGPLSGTESNSALPQAEGFIDLTEPFTDTNQNGIWDDEELYTDSNENGIWDADEPFIDKANGKWDPPKGYEIACAQLCGNAHYRMRGFVTVETEEEFNAWLEEEAEYLEEEDEDDDW